MFSYSKYIREQEREAAAKRMAEKDRTTAERLLSLDVSPDITQKVADLISVIEQIQGNLTRKTSSSGLFSST